MPATVEATPEDPRLKKYIRRGLIAWTVTHAVVVTLFLFLNMRVAQSRHLMASLAVATSIEYGAAVMLLAATDKSNWRLLNICYLYYVLKATAYAGLLVMCELLKPIWRPDLMEFRSVDPLRFYMLLDNRGLAVIDLVSQIYLTMLVRMHVQALGGKPLFSLSWLWGGRDSGNQEPTPEDQTREESNPTSEEATNEPTPEEAPKRAPKQATKHAPKKPTKRTAAQPMEPTVADEPRSNGLSFLSILHVVVIVVVFVIILNDVSHDIIDQIKRRFDAIDVNDTSDDMKMKIVRYKGTLLHHEEQ